MKELDGESLSETSNDPEEVDGASSSKSEDESLVESGELPRGDAIPRCDVCLDSWSRSVSWSVLVDGRQVRFDVCVCG